jgi:hypothetical protein
MPPQYHPSNRAAVADDIKTAKAQPRAYNSPLALLIRLHPQHLIQGSRLWERITLETPTNPALSLDRPKQAQQVAWGKAFAPQRDPHRLDKRAKWSAGELARRAQLRSSVLREHGQPTPWLESRQ